MLQEKGSSLYISLSSLVQLGGKKVLSVQPSCQISHSFSSSFILIQRNSCAKRQAQSPLRRQTRTPIQKRRNLNLQNTFPFRFLSPLKGLEMEKPKYRMRLPIFFVVVFLGAVAFSCCIAAEFTKVKAKDMKLDGSLCSLPSSSAFGLGVAALVCLSIAQIVGTTAAATRSCIIDKKSPRRNRMFCIVLLVLSWISFGLTAIFLGTGSSMNNGQPYGRGWLNGECYVVKDGLYTGAAILTAATVIIVLGLTFFTRKRIQQRTGPDEESNQGIDVQQK